jgi:tryptophan-rich sensory protein
MAPFPASRQIAGLVAWLFVTFVAAALGAAASVHAGTFYAQLLRPAWAPPGWLFGPVWSALYLAMGIAAWLVWRAAGFHAARAALTLYLVQLALNALWSWLFFGWHLGAAAFADVLLLWAAIVATLVAFRRVRPLAAWLLAPYLLWVSFASALNFAVWQLNPGSL